MTPDGLRAQYLIPNLSLSAIAYPSIHPFRSGHVITQSRKISANSSPAERKQTADCELLSRIFLKKPSFLQTDFSQSWAHKSDSFLYRILVLTAGESGSILACWSSDGEVWKVTRVFQRWGGLQSNQSWADVALGAFYCSETPGKWRDRKQSARKEGRQCRHRVRLTPVILHRKRLINGAHHEGPTHKLHTKGMRAAVG
jgi:hypothetical protein